MRHLSEDWNGIREIIPYGFGWEASRCIDKLMEDFYIPFIIDNSPQKAGTFYKNVPIITWETAKGKIANKKIVITTRYRRYVQIAETLNAFGLHNNIDFCSIKDFIPEWYWENQEKCCLYTVDMTVSAKCNFKCRNCNMFMPYYKTNIQYTLDELKQNIDDFFGVVDYVCYIGFIGGEPLLCTCLNELIHYIVDNYQGKVGDFTIHTNGSIMPPDELIDTILENNITVAVSDYGKESPCREKMLQNVAVLEAKGVYCDVRASLEWRNVGFPTSPKNYTDEEVKEHMMACSADWRGVNDGKFYYCNIAWSAQKAGLTVLEDDDYLVLKELKMLGNEGKEKLLSYCEGNFEKGYISFCKQCGGCGLDNTDLVVPGVQL